MVELESELIELPKAGPQASASKRLPCAITRKQRTRKDFIRLDTVRPALANRIRAEHPQLLDDALISRSEINRYRVILVEELLCEEHGQFSELDREVAEAMANQETIAENIEEELDKQRTFGERLSDLIANFGGSWTFLITFALFLAVWMAMNFAQGQKAFDPYPFILLNLVLSAFAAVQAPVIMMSQQRQQAKDRHRSLNDYKVNLKAELEIRHLHEKLDHLITRQWQRLAEIQQIQLEIMQDSHRRNS